MKIELIILIISLPLLGGIVGYFKPSISGKISIALIAVSLLSVFYLLAIGAEDISYRWRWLPKYEIGIFIDSFAEILLGLVSFISLLVNLFSISYVDPEERPRYFLKLGLFTSSMLGLLVSDHLLLLFVFWELVGLSSYLLIGFWYKKEKVPQSAKTAFLVNRVADVALIIGILLLNGNSELFISELNGTWLFVPSILIAIGAFGKSAQLPFSGWLIKAMAGPTPVSALIHAATMVAAGVYLLIRTGPYMHEDVLTIIALVGALTTFLAGLSAIVQNDIKSVLAYSTISQLGYMVLGVGVGAGYASSFHLWTHAFFKAGLFLGAGAIISFLKNQFFEDEKLDPQDLRNMGGLASQLPWTFRTFLVCTLALAGVPFLSGFMSKEGIILASWTWAESIGSWAYLIPDIAIISVLITAFYSGRLLMLIFGGKRKSTAGAKDFENVGLVLPLVLLALGTVWLFYSFNPFSHSHNLTYYLGQAREISDSLIPSIISIVLVLGGLGLAIFLFRAKSEYSKAYRQGRIDTSTSFIGEGFYMVNLYNVVGIVAINLAKATAWVDQKIVDRMLHLIAIGGVVFAKGIHIFERLIVDGLVNFSAWVSSLLGKALALIHARDVKWQLIWMLILFVLILFWILLF